MAEADGPKLDSGLSYIRESENLGTFAETVMTVFGSIFVVAGAVVTAVGDAAGGLVVRILTAFGVGSEQWIYAFTRDPANYISKSFSVGADGFTNTAFAQLGPFLPWIGTLVAVGVVFIVTEYLDRQNSDVPGIGANIPIVNNQDEEDDGQ